MGSSLEVDKEAHTREEGDSSTKKVNFANYFRSRRVVRLLDGLLSCLLNHNVEWDLGKGGWRDGRKLILVHRDKSEKYLCKIIFTNTKVLT